MRIAIVNDVLIAVEALRRVVTSVPNHQIAWVATDGEEAVVRCAADVPDLILMDLMMPRMDGAEASRLIMRSSPCAILIVTATIEGHSSKVFEAMGWGALDAVRTPVLEISGGVTRATELLGKISMLEKLLGKSPSRLPTIPVTPSAGSVDPPAFPLVAIGASTGGPAAIARILSSLPPQPSLAIAIVQHVDEFFAPGLAQWLARETGRVVRIIQPGDQPEASVVQIASTTGHLMLTPNLEFKYTQEPADYCHRPSIDVFFQSVVNCWPAAAVGVLLTGMGADGARGLLAMRSAGWHTIAQDQSTSVVYGMPKAAARIDAAVEILPLERIGEAIAGAAGRFSTRKKSHHRSRT